MKKVLFSICAILLFSGASAQTWKTIKLDSVVSIKLPFAYTMRDTLGQKVLNSKTAYGNVQILVTPDNPMKTPDIEKEKHLLKYYNSYLNKVKKSSKGTVANQAVATIGDLKAKDFTLEVDSGKGKQIRAFRILHENCATYTFQFLYESIHEEIASEERKQFFNSIAVANDPMLASQFTSKPETSKGPSRMIWYAGAGVVLLAILIIGLVVMRRNKSKT